MAEAGSRYSVLLPTGAGDEPYRPITTEGIPTVEWPDGQQFSKVASGHRLRHQQPHAGPVGVEPLGQEVVSVQKSHSPIALRHCNDGRNLTGVTTGSTSRAVTGNHEVRRSHGITHSGHRRHWHARAPRRPALRDVDHAAEDGIRFVTVALAKGEGTEASAANPKPPVGTNVADDRKPEGKETKAPLGR